MNKAGPVAEPSMEEILASIRRIISDGEEQGHASASVSDAPTAGDADSAPDGGVAREDPTLSAAQTAEPSSAEAQAVAAPGDDEPADDILELTEEMFASDEPATADAPPAAEAQFERAPEPEVADPASQDEPDGDVGGPTAMPTVEGHQPDVAFGEAPAAASSSPEPAPQPDPSAPDAEAAPSADVARQSAPAGQAESAAAGSSQDATLLSPASDAAVASAFGRLANTILSQDPRTLEDLVEDMLRPMLREWLDDNLPPLVERLVRAEIERVSRGS